MHNPPNLWITINPSDTQDPIAQVMAGEDIDLNKFNSLVGPTATQRAMNIASDPYASARYFHTVVRLVLETMFGIKVKRGHNIERKEGIFGTVNSYIGTVEAQGRGSLHLHLLLWLTDSPTSSEMQKALADESFREKMRNFIKQNIRADINNANELDLKAMPVIPEVSYSRPIDPRTPNFDELNSQREHQLARTVQVHTCKLGRCQKVVGSHLVCKHRAPFPLSSDDWVSEEGEWGPKRLSGSVNNFCPPLLDILRSNHDIKLIISSGLAKKLAWYLYRYAAKKQLESFNASALLARDFAYQLELNKKTNDILDTNKRLIQRCANTLSRHHEFSAPEVSSYIMGWGDRYESHYYVTIYWDSAVVALKRHFPELRSKKHLDFLNAHGANTNDTEELDTQSRLVIKDGEIRLNDQLKDYQYRGDLLREQSFLEFNLNTYEASFNGQEDMPNPTNHTRLRSVRVPYKAEADKKKQCRVIRGAGHETMPNFVGQWFPRNDDPNTREFYCASMLMLFQPWQTMYTLKEASESFEASFNRFSLSAKPQVKQMLDNIQFYHDSSDCAKRDTERRDQALGPGHDVIVDDDQSPEDETYPDQMDETVIADVTEEDIERS
ncbi:hypothetical protein Hypma_009540 [Hypsizygus marmoreus]|uniref:Helitron helicase-like domain-containing protein n=1 Tax=Hypsizygus marmoreus TaxID=39966 RepID=A0A369JQR0_HYPMA|nr:hypothetical protein Hypma_009540 [Hypsizygus marmoreus]